jgi:multidrug efflux pump subunit AcrA (membrane-fusion protein)
MRKHLVINGSLVVVAAAIGMGTYASIGSGATTAASRETIVTAKRAVVLSSVSATGNVEAATDLDVSFQQSGKVTAIYVKVGDHVTAGQQLAQIDDTQQAGALASAEASLASAQAQLAAQLRGETAAERAQDAAGLASAAQSVASAQLGVTHAQQSATANATKNQQQIDQAQTQLDAAQTTLSAAKTALERAESSLSTLQSSYDPNASSGENADARVTRYKLDQVTCGVHSGTAGYHTPDGVDCSQIVNLISFGTNVQSAQTSETQAASGVTTAQNALTSAQQGQTAGQLQDQQAIDNATSQLNSANLQYQSTVAGNAVKEQPAKPESIAQSRAAITSAQQQLTTAQQNEDETVLAAPVAGTVASVSGRVGQDASGGSSAAASSSSSSSSTSSTSSTSSGFVQLTNTSSLDVKVGFTETDAPKIKVGEAATITLDALTGQTFTGRILSLDTNQTVVSNVVTYYAKVSVDDASASIKPGMTASVDVVLDKRDNAVTLPTSAVPTSGTTATVTVRGTDGKDTTRSITIGLRGDSAVEINSGLTVGDKVVVTSRAASATPTGFPGGGGGPAGGGLGGRVGG